MATIDLITYDQKMVTPKDDALIHQFGISNGVLYGCEVTLVNSNTLHITGGQGVIYGRQWEIAEGDITVTLPASGSLKGRLYVKIDLSNTTNPIELLVQTAVTLPDLTDDDQINVDNSVSELEICTFDVSSLTISNLERTVEQVADGDHQDVVDLQADVSEIKSNLTDLEYTLVDAKYGNVAMDLPANWKELVIYFRYGNSGGLQSQVIQGGLLRIHASSAFAYAVGSGTIVAQFTVNTNDNTITMIYFAIGTTAYTTTSQMTVYARN